MKQAVWLAAALMMLLPLGKVYSKERSERENKTLRIMSYNIRNGSLPRCRGRTGARQCDRP